MTIAEVCFPIRINDPAEVRLDILVWRNAILVEAVADDVLRAPQMLLLNRRPAGRYRVRFLWPSRRVCADLEPVNPALAVPKRDWAIANAVRRYWIADVVPPSSPSGTTKVVKLETEFSGAVLQRL